MSPRKVGPCLKELHHKRFGALKANVLNVAVLSLTVGPGKTEQETGVQASLWEFTIPARPAVSEGCKDLLRRLLTVNPKARINSAGCQAHPWFLEARFPGSLFNVLEGERRITPSQTDAR